MRTLDSTNFEFVYKLSDQEMIEIFGIELLSKVDSTCARDHAINNLLGNG